MIEAIATCIALGWMASTGPVTHYDVYKDLIFETTVQVAQWDSFCREGHDYNNPHTIHVVPFNADGLAGPPSDPLTVQWVLYYDHDGDGVVGWIDFTAFGGRYGDCYSENRVIVVPCD